jgi:uncharacterized protein YjiS (DUF1127 family)
MALTDTSRFPGWHVPAGCLPAPPRRVGVIQLLWDHYRAWQAQRETVRRLNSLDSATLRDLGISPREIESLVYGEAGDRIRDYDPGWWRREL